MTNAQQKGRRTLLLVALVFLGPMAVAMALYFTGFQLRPEGTTQHGILFQPARSLPDLSMTVLSRKGGSATLSGKWTLIYIGPGDCPADCRQALVEMRQGRRALGRDMDRVQRLYLVTAGSVDRGFLITEHPGIGLAEGESAPTGLLQAVGSVQPGDIFLADPLGNLVMRYPAGTTMKGMHQDLQRLLKISTIG
jgi:hypothetical protein